MNRASDDDARFQQRLTRWLLAAFAAWAAILALGAALFGYDPRAGEVGFYPNPWRGVITLAVAGIFLGGWWLLLRQRRQSRNAGG